MSTDANLVVITGRLTRDPEVRQSQSGTSWCRVGVAVNRWRPGKDGAPGTEDVQFIDVVAFGNTAEHLARGAKGTKVLVRGHLHLSNRDDRTELSVVVDEANLLAEQRQAACP